jgi:4-hydroxy 2-oxovalerate aldolase
MDRIKAGLEESGVEIIELGYIDGNKGAPAGRTQFISDAAIVNSFLKHKKEGVKYVAMIDYGKFDIDQLLPRDESTLDGIRVAFHKKDRFQAIEWGKKIIAKGYMMFVQPMLTLRYSDQELLEFVDRVNQELPQAEAFYIVDSFGEMRQNDLTRLSYLVDHNLSPQICMGFHSHNNLQLSYSNAISLLSHETDRNLIVDSSIMGMGKGAGNLNTELFTDHLNLYHKKNYAIKPLLCVIDEVLNQVAVDFHWGYSVDHYLSALHSCTPSYAEYFFNKHMLTIDRLDTLLGKIEEHKKISFDAAYAEQLYLDFNRHPFDDAANLDTLKARIDGKKVVLIASGHSILDAVDSLRQQVAQPDTFSIAVNHCNMIETNFIFANRESIYDEAQSKQLPTLYLSSINNQQDAGNLIFDYAKWTDINGQKNDNAFFVITKILASLGVSEIQLAGFDGFDLDMAKSYYDLKLARPKTKEQVDKKNQEVIDFIHSMSEQVQFIFLTQSKYQAAL